MGFKKIRTFSKSEEQGLKVVVRNDNVDKALRIFKKKVLASGLMDDLREREFYESRGTKRRKAKDAATRRFKKRLQQRKEEFGY